MPEYDLSGDKVKVTIIGKVLDMDYARVLAKNSDLSLDEIIMLDKVQKKKPLTLDEARYLKTKKLIEGRKPNYFISIGVAQKTDQKATYSKHKAFDKAYYLDLILKSIKQHGSLNRKDIDDLLWEKLPGFMNDEQKNHKISNLIAQLRKKGKIKNIGIDKKSIWVQNLIRNRK